MSPKGMNQAIGPQVFNNADGKRRVVGEIGNPGPNETGFFATIMRYGYGGPEDAMVVAVRSCELVGTRFGTANDDMCRRRRRGVVFCRKTMGDFRRGNRCSYR